MRLDTRVARLEAAGPDPFLTAVDRDAACARYADSHASMVGVFPNAMSPTDYRTALETIRDPKHQRIFACWMPGDDDI